MGIGFCGLCRECGKEVRKNYVPRSKSGRVFCGSSCAARYNNTHKTTGTRRSKLEGWLEERLRELYPDLDIHCNRRDAINGELDFYFPSLKLAFELNGIFHYEPIYGVESLEKCQNNDARKMQACFERGIELCVIDVSRQLQFTINGSEKFLCVIRQVLDRVIVNRLRLGWGINSTDPLRGRPKPPAPTPPPPFKATEALELALKWESELKDTRMSQRAFAKQKGVSQPYVVYVLRLLQLPKTIREALLRRDPAYGNLKISQAHRLRKKMSPENISS